MQRQLQRVSLLYLKMQLPISGVFGIVVVALHQQQKPMMTRMAQ